MHQSNNKECQPTVPEAADSSSENSTDTEMGLVDVCTIPLTIRRQKRCTGSVRLDNVGFQQS